MSSVHNNEANIKYLNTEVVVLGSGPGGYTAAFRAADLGKKVTLIDRSPILGGVCLNMGCIPSKALLHAARVINEVKEMNNHGLRFRDFEIDIKQLREWKDKEVIEKLTTGLSRMAVQRNVHTITGSGRLMSQFQLEVHAQNGEITVVNFEHAILAAGSHPIVIPGLPEDPRIMDSTGALDLNEIPERLLVVGGGIIGMELGTVYEALGSKVSVVELGSGLLPGCDRDLVRPLQKRMETKFERILLQTKVSNISPEANGLRVTFDGEISIEPQLYDRVLMAVGRRPNSKSIGVENVGVLVNDQGYILVDKQMRTNIPNIFAIGDIVGQPMLAHKATHEAKVAAEVIAGKQVEFQASVIPSVAYTDPEIAWVGVTETEAVSKAIPIDKASFPWAASGRAISIGRPEGQTKLIFDRESHKLIGAGIVGINAGELLAEAALAIEMGADAATLGLTIHAHPTLSETICFAAEIKEETITDLYIRKKLPNRQHIATS